MTINGHLLGYDYDSRLHYNLHYFPLLDPPFKFYCKLNRLQAEKYLDARENRLHNKTLRIQKFSDSKLSL